jgi:hypothetical protein
VTICARSQLVHMSNGSQYQDVGWIEGNLSGFCKSISNGSDYADGWELIQHALCLSVFGSDSMTEPRPLCVKIYSDGQIQYVRTSELPDPVRTVFEIRQFHSTRPVISGAPDAY